MLKYGLTPSLLKAFLLLFTILIINACADDEGNTENNGAEEEAAIHEYTEEELTSEDESVSDTGETEEEEALGEEDIRDSFEESPEFADENARWGIAFPFDVTPSNNQSDEDTGLALGETCSSDYDCSLGLICLRTYTPRRQKLWIWNMSVTRFWNMLLGKSHSANNEEITYTCQHPNPR